MKKKKKKRMKGKKNTTSPNKVVISSDMPKQGDNFILINVPDNKKIKQSTPSLKTPVPKNAINLIKLILILFSLKKIKIQMKTNLNLLIIKL